jgi:hypothetical protein
MVFTLRAGQVVRLGAYHDTAVKAVRSPVRPATRRMPVVSMASASVIAGGMAGRRRASLDVPAPGGPSRSR